MDKRHTGKRWMLALVGIPSEPAEITVQPADASNPGVVWESADESVATVNQDGAITGVRPGKTTVTATAADGSGKSCKLTVTVYQQIQSVTLDQQEVALEKKQPQRWERTEPFTRSAATRKASWK